MVLLTTGVSMIMAAMNVRYRDVKYVLPFAIQLGLFATPIIYPVSMIPKRFQPILALNPCWGMVDGFRACLFPNQPMDLKLMATSTTVTLCGVCIWLLLFSEEWRKLSRISFEAAQRKGAVRQVMSTAIFADNVSKQYQIGRANLTLREHLTNLMSLADFRKKEPEEDNMGAA